MAATASATPPQMASHAGPSSSRTNDIAGEIIVNNVDEEEASLRLAIHLQLADFEQTQDEEDQLIMEEYRRYLEETEQILADRDLAAAMSGEVPTVEENLAMMTGSRARLDGEDDFAFACRLSLLSYDIEHGAYGSVIEESLAAAKKIQRRIPAPCTGCTDMYPGKKLVTTPCKHPYCFSCIRQFFINASRDEQAFPPRCCKVEIPIFLVRKHMSDKELQLFRQKTEEYTSKDRVYCANPSCSTFISVRAGSSGSDKIAICKTCKLGTCLLCKSAEHAGTDCPEDKDLTLTLTKAAEMGWQRCHQCLSIVERAYGCQHMSCRCGSEWCYSCAKKWKTCQCGDWEPEGGPVAPRSIDQLRIQPQGGQAAAEAMRTKLRNERIHEDQAKRRNCRHGNDELRKMPLFRPKGKEKEQGNGKGKAKQLQLSRDSDDDDDDDDAGYEHDSDSEEEDDDVMVGLWRYKSGVGRCEVCQNMMKDYVWMCEGCGKEACKRCRHQH